MTQRSIFRVEEAIEGHTIQPKQEQVLLPIREKGRSTNLQAEPYNTRRTYIQGSNDGDSGIIAEEGN
jgi:hypothetical protein